MVSQSKLQNISVVLKAKKDRKTNFIWHISTQFQARCHRNDCMAGSACYLYFLQARREAGRSLLWTPSAADPSQQSAPVSQPAFLSTALGCILLVPPWEMANSQLQGPESFRRSSSCICIMQAVMMLTE